MGISAITNVRTQNRPDVYIYIYTYIKEGLINKKFSQGIHFRMTIY